MGIALPCVDILLGFWKRKDEFLIDALILDSLGSVSGMGVSKYIMPAIIKPTPKAIKNADEKAEKVNAEELGEVK